MAAVAQGRSCSDKEEQEKVVCKAAAILRSRPLAALPMTTENPPTSAYAGTSGFCHLYSAVHIEPRYLLS